MGRTCGIVHGCVFVSVGVGPVIFFYMYHTNFNSLRGTLGSVRVFWFNIQTVSDCRLSHGSSKPRNC